MKKNFIKPSVKALKIDNEALMATSTMISDKKADNNYPQGGDAKQGVQSHYSLDMIDL